MTDGTWLEAARRLAVMTATPPPTAWPGREDAKLSRLQKAILSALAGMWDDRVKHFGPDSVLWGVRIGSKPEGYTASDRAAYSRALRRLEARGFVLRQNIVGSVTGGVRGSNAEPHNRTTNVVVTAAGLELAKRLTKN